MLDEQLTTRDHAKGETIPPPLDRTTFPHHQAGSEQVSFKDSLGSCYRTAIRSRDERLTKFSEGKGCPGDVNRLDARSRPGNPWLVPVNPAQSD